MEAEELFERHVAQILEEEADQESVFTAMSRLLHCRSPPLRPAEDGSIRSWQR